MRVTAIDASAEMLARLRAKLARESPRLQADVDVQRGNVDEVAPALVGPFDGIISSFAALNTVDLSTFALHAARLLRRRGRFVCHMLSTGHGQSAWARLLGRRPARDAPGARTVVVGGEPLTHLDVPPDEIYRRFFRAHFDARGGYALGLFVSGAMEARLPASPPRSRRTFRAGHRRGSGAGVAGTLLRAGSGATPVMSSRTGAGNAPHAGRVAQRSSGFTTPGQTAAP